MAALLFMLNPNLSTLLSYLRTTKVSWNYELNSPLDLLPELFPGTYSWNKEFQTFDLKEELPPNTTVSGYVAKFFGMPTQKYLDIFVFLEGHDGPVTQEQFTAALEEYTKTQEN